LGLGCPVVQRVGKQVKFPANQSFGVVLPYLCSVRKEQLLEEILYGAPAPSYL